MTTKFLFTPPNLFVYPLNGLCRITRINYYVSCGLCCMILLMFSLINNLDTATEQTDT